jgi:cation:H+ antiporter
MPTTSRSGRSSALRCSWRRSRWRSSEWRRSFIASVARLDLEPLLLSLALAPFATKLPEKANSFFWVRDGKDSLALGNITGAMVFQSTLPVSIGLAFTSWELDRYSIVAGCLALAGGLLAILTLQVRRRFTPRAIVLWALLYLAFVAYVVATA